MKYTKILLYLQWHNNTTIIDSLFTSYTPSYNLFAWEILSLLSSIQPNYQNKKYIYNKNYTAYYRGKKGCHCPSDHELHLLKCSHTNKALLKRAWNHYHSLRTVSFFINSAIISKRHEWRSSFLLCVVIKDQSSWESARKACIVSNWRSHDYLQFQRKGGGVKERLGLTHVLFGFQQSNRDFR